MIPSRVFFNTCKVLLLCNVLSLLPHVLFSQSALRDQLKGKSTLNDIMRVVDAYYTDQQDNWRGPDGADPRYKHWKRWEWYMSSRLGPGGSFVDINQKLMDAKKSLPEATRSIIPSWFSEGPTSVGGSGIGRADRIAFHPTDANTFYVGTPAGGLWRTTNGGSSWTALSDNIPSLGISGIVVNWADPNDLYILTGDGDSDVFGGLVDQFDYERKSVGVLKSIDGGVNWFETGPIDSLPYLGFKLVQSPVDANVLLVATDLGIYKTENGGGSWIKVRTGDFYDLEFKPNTGRAYACSTTEVVYSVNEGSSWNISTYDIPMNGVWRPALAVTEDEPNYVFLLVGDTENDTTGVFDGVYRSTNSGQHFVLMGTTPNILGRESDGSDNYQQARYDLALAVSHTNASKLVTGCVYIWNSPDAGLNFDYSASGSHADVHDLAFNPLDDKLYACTDGGVYVSEDFGLTWEKRLSGFSTSQFYHLDGTTLDEEYMIGGFQDNGIKLKDSTAFDWDYVGGGDGFAVSFYPNTESKFYATANKRVYRFSNNGEDAADITPPGGASGQDYQFFGNVVAHHSDSTLVFVGYDNVFRSDNEGDDWEDLGASGSWAIITCPSNANRIYTAGATSFDTSSFGGLWRSDNLGDNWTALHNNSGFPDFGVITKITDIAVNPSNSNEVYVTIGGFVENTKVFRSTNAGGSWSPYSGSLPNIPVNCIAVLSGGDDVYIGTDLGVFFRRTGMSDWMPYNNRLPNVPVTDFFVNESEGDIYAATFGRGIWRSSIATECPESVFVGGNLKGSYLYQAIDYINSSADIIGGIGTDVHFKAGNYVLLEPGFIALRHTVFGAYIEACGTGGIPDGIEPEDEIVEIE